MSLREILEGIVERKDNILLESGGKEFEAGALLETLHPVKLKRQAHLQNGLYIAAISDAGYLGGVMYKVKSNVFILKRIIKIRECLGIAREDWRMLR